MAPAAAMTVDGSFKEIGQRLHRRTGLHHHPRAAGPHQGGRALRPDIEVGDISLLLEQLQAVRVGDPQRTRQLRHRYLTLLVGGLHLTTADPLPGPPPTPEEVSRRYNG